MLFLECIPGDRSAALRGQWCAAVGVQGNASTTAADQTGPGQVKHIQTLWVYIHVLWLQVVIPDVRGAWQGQGWGIYRPEPGVAIKDNAQRHRVAMA